MSCRDSPNQVGVDNAVGKVDYTISQNNSLSGMYFYGNNSGTVEDFPDGKLNGAPKSIPAPRWWEGTGFGCRMRAG